MTIYLLQFKYLPVELARPAVSGTWQYPSPPWQVSAWPHSANPTFRRNQINRAHLFGIWFHAYQLSVLLL